MKFTHTRPVAALRRLYWQAAFLPVRARFALAAAIAGPAPGAPAYAQKLSDVSRNVEDEAGALAMGFLVVMALVGLFLVGVGLFKLIRGEERGESAAKAGKFIIVGALLISIPGILVILNNSIFDGDAGTQYIDELQIR